ncbi:MAG: MerR family transcriptional regulator [Gemmatimonadota bacterium]
MATYTLEELAEHTGVNARSIRHYIQRGLLRGPETRGRHARYADYHRRRLEVIRTLRDDYDMPLAEIRQHVTMAGPDEDVASSPVALYTSGPPPEAAHEPASALDFVRARQATTRARPAQVESEAVQYPSASSGPIDRLLQQLRRHLADRAVARKARGEEWVRVPVTPDIEVHVRGHLAADQLRAFEQLADHMRHILLGDSDHD